MWLVPQVEKGKNKQKHLHKFEQHESLKFKSSFFLVGILLLLLLLLLFYRSYFKAINIESFNNISGYECIYVRFLTRKRKVRSCFNSAFFSFLCMCLENFPAHQLKRSFR